MVKTPNLDSMAREGIRFNRFYSGAPVCSPTRGSCLTGRHPFRYGIKWAGRDPLPKEEITLAEALKSNGYATGHFGKWHLGGLSRTLIQGEFPGGPSPYSPPWENGSEECSIISFCSDNGPSYIHYYNSARPFRGKKSELYEGETTDIAHLQPNLFTYMKNKLLTWIRSCKEDGNTENQ